MDQLEQVQYEQNLVEAYMHLCDATIALLENDCGPVLELLRDAMRDLSTVALSPTLQQIFKRVPNAIEELSM
ncbi:MAG: hypothetical protein DRI37_05005 [Chloroflexi bacterium]|nr:MAG: hypothetical protein DRI37_05005 [Chloroflexota bacterium]